MGLTATPPEQFQFRWAAARPRHGLLAWGVAVAACFVGRSAACGLAHGYRRWLSPPSGRAAGGGHACALQERTKLKLAVQN